MGLFSQRSEAKHTRNAAKLNKQKSELNATRFSLVSDASQARSIIRKEARSCMGSLEKDAVRRYEAGHRPEAVHVMSDASKSAMLILPMTELEAELSVNCPAGWKYAITSHRDGDGWFAALRITLRPA